MYLIRYLRIGLVRISNMNSVAIDLGSYLYCFAGCGSAGRAPPYSKANGIGTRLCIMMRCDHVVASGPITECPGILCRSILEGRDKSKCLAVARCTQETEIALVVTGRQWSRDQDGVAFIPDTGIADHHLQANNIPARLCIFMNRIPAGSCCSVTKIPFPR